MRKIYLEGCYDQDELDVRDSHAITVIFEPVGQPKNVLEPSKCPIYQGTGTTAASVTGISLGKTS